jgi:hypothetical protein
MPLLVTGDYRVPAPDSANGFPCSRRDLVLVWLVCFRGCYRKGPAMITWTTDELDRIGNADELQVISQRPDGTLRNPVTIWVVRHGDDLYIRSYKGLGGAWFRHLQEHRDGRIQAGGVDKDVTFADADHELDDQIDAAYRTKYHGYSASYVDPMVTAQARSTTTRLVPRAAGG